MLRPYRTLARHMRIAVMTVTTVAANYVAMATRAGMLVIAGQLHEVNAHASLTSPLGVSYPPGIYPPSMPA